MGGIDRAGRDGRVLAPLAVLLVLAGLVLAATAPGGPPGSNKVNAYGGPVQTQPTNPKSKAECDSYYQATNQLADARECRAIAAKNVALRRCAKKKGAKRVACGKAAKRSFAKAKAKVAKQRKAERACAEAYNKGFQAADPEAPDYDAQMAALSATSNACYKKAQS